MADTQDAEETPSLKPSDIKSRFEQKASDSAPVKRNFGPGRGKFGSGPVKCKVCEKSVYPVEKIEVEGVTFHKFCFKCDTCQRTLSLSNYASLQGVMFCKPHLKQKFQLKGNYDEGFGREQHKAAWVKNKTTDENGAEKAIENQDPDQQTKKTKQNSTPEKEENEKEENHKDEVNEKVEEKQSNATPNQKEEKEGPDNTTNINSRHGIIIGNGADINNTTSSTGKITTATTKALQGSVATSVQETKPFSCGIQFADSGSSSEEESSEEESSDEE